MVMLHQWLQQEYRIGYSEGEVCRGHGDRIPAGQQILTLRMRHMELEMWGPVIEAWCMTCAEVMDVKVGPRGGPAVRADQMRRDLGRLTQEFWAGTRDERGRETRLGKRYW